MNHIYRSVWNDTLGCVVAISELGTSKGKKSSTLGEGHLGCPGFALRALSVSLLMGIATTAYALPSAGVVSSGSATITSSGPGSLLITQASQNALLNWQSFGIGAKESVQFVQPGSNSVAINRVLGSDPSQIFGNLSANGKVFLVNPNGILFGKGASVNVGGLVASALDLTDADFTAGRYRFSGTGGGEVTNLGSIYAEPGGSVALLGARVGNEGTISANLGSVALAAGSAATVDVPIDGLIHVTVDKSAAHALASNGGLIEADGGEVLITAHAKDALLDTVVNNQGIVQANSVGFRNGRIVLDGGDSGLVTVGGTLRASGTTPSMTGGTIIASGDKVLIADHAQLDAKGSSGGGGIYVGGGWQGSDPDIRQASGVYVAQSATLDASASVNGNGGTVVAWSDVHNPQSATRVYGSLVARGGAEGGDGGRIETSGHWLDVAGLKVDAAGPSGKGGQWLLDPDDLTVSAAPTTIVAGACPLGSPPACTYFLSTPLTSNVLNTTINTQLDAGTSVVLQTGAAPGGPGDITISASIAKTAGANASLTLFAHRDIVMNTAAKISSTTGTLDVNFFGTNNITVGAGSQIISNGGDISLSGASFINNAGAGALNVAGGGRWVVYSNDPSTNVFGSLNSGNQAIWGQNPGSLPLPAVPAGNRFVFTTLGAVTATTVSDSKIYGQSISVAGDITYSGLPLTSAVTYGNVYQNLAASDALSALPTASSAGESSTASVGAYSIAAGGGAANPGYSLAYVDSGTLSVGKAPLTVTANNASRLYGAPNPALSATVSGFVNGETVATAAGFGGSASVSTAATPTTGVGSVAITPAVGTLTAVNYDFLTLQNGALTITKAPLTVTASNDTKTYNGVAYSGGNGVVYSGFLNSETSAVLSGPLTYTGTSQGAKNAGSYVITPGGLSGANYAVSFVDGLLTITPAGLSAIVASLTGTTSKVYDGTTTATLTPGNFSLSGFATGEGASVTKTSGTYDTAGAGTNKSVTVSLSASDYAAVGGTLLSNYTLPTTVSGAIGTITKAPLTVTASNASRLYGAANPTLSATVSGFVNGETVGTAAGFGGSAAVSTTATATTGVGSVVITPTAGTLTAANYDFTTLQNGALTITKAPLTVTAHDEAKAYNGAAYSGGNGVVYAGFVNSETNAVLSGALAFAGTSQGAKNAGGYVITPQGLSSANYAVSFVNGTLTIGKAPLTVTANNDTKTYNGAAYSGGNGVSFSGFVNSETSAVLGGALAYVGTSQGARNAGSFAITPSGLTSVNYAVSFVDGLLTISPAGLSAIVASLTGSTSKVYDGTTAATLTPGNFRLSGFLTGEGASVSKTSGTYDTAGAGANKTVTVNLSSSDYTASSGTLLANYTLPTTVSGAIGTISKAPLTVTADDASRTYGAPNPALSATVSGFVSGETIATAAGFGGSASVSTSATATTGVGGVAITTAVGTLTAANYDFTTLQNGTLTIGKAPLTVTANNDTKTYNGAAYSGGNGVSFSGFVNSETSAVLGGALAYVGTSQGARNAGSFAITPSGLTSVNYAVSFVDGLLTISPAGLSAIVASLTGSTSKVYDGTTAATLTPGNFRLSGFLTGEGASVSKTSGTYDTAGAGANKTVTVNLSSSDYTASSGTLLANYTLPTTVSGAIGTISKAPLTVTAKNVAKTYNGVAFSGGNGVEYSGFVNSETSSVLGGALAYVGTSQGAVNAGQYGITASGLTSQNYAFDYVPSALTVKPKEVTVTGLIADKKDFDGTRTAVILDWGNAATGVGSETLVLNHGNATFSDSIVGTGKTVTADGYSLADGSQRGLASNYVLTSTSAQTLANIVVGERTTTISSVQSSTSASGPSPISSPKVAVTGAGIGQSSVPLVNLMVRDSALDTVVITANGRRIDGSNPDGSSASQDTLQSSSGGPAGTTRVAGQTGTAGPAPANRVAGQAAAGGINPRGPSTGSVGAMVGGTAGSAVSGSSSSSGTPPGTTRFSTSGLSSMPRPVPVPSRPQGARQVPQQVFLRGASSAQVVGRTTNGDAIVASVSTNANVTRLGVTVVEGDGFAIAIPASLLASASAVGGGAAVQLTTPSGGAVPSWLTLDRSSMRLNADNVPASGLPLTVKLAAGTGKSVEVTFK